MKTKVYGIRKLSIDTVIWLDGGTSIELAYKRREKGSITKKDTGPRAAFFKFIPDFIGVWSPL